MVGLTLNRYVLALMAAATLIKAIDPSPEVRKKWDDKCKAKSGQLYYMVFDNNGQPTGTCQAPPFKGCYWGPYKDPKTGLDGCCEKGNGVFSTDPVATLEGGCCIGPRQYKYDTNAQKGGCCPQNTHLTWDLSFQPPTQLGLCCPPEQVTSTDRATGQNHCCPPGLTYSSHLASGQGECCEPGKAFSFDAGAQKGDCCAAGQTYKVDPLTGKGGCCGAGVDYKCNCSCGNNKSGTGNNSGTGDNGANISPPTKCPEVEGRRVTLGGITYEIQCATGISDRFDSYIEKTTNGVGECMALCSADPKCQGANLYDNGADEGCVMMKDWEYPATGAVSPGTDMMSFVPIARK